MQKKEPSLAAYTNAFYTKPRKYTLFDFLRFGFHFSPLLATLRVLYIVIDAALPAFTVLLTADFVDTALRIARGEQPRSAIFLCLGLLLGVQLFKYVQEYLIGFVKIGLRQAAERKIRAAVVAKRTRLAYRHIENSETWDLCVRIGEDPTTKFIVGFDKILGNLGTVVGIVSLAAVLIRSAWWALPVLLVFAVPGFFIHAKGGRKLYEERKALTKHWRHLEYLESLLTGKESVEERALFDYDGSVTEKWEAEYRQTSKKNNMLWLKKRTHNNLVSLITLFGSVLIYGLLVLPLRAGAITIGVYISLIGTVAQLMQAFAYVLPDVVFNYSELTAYLAEYTKFCALEEVPGANDLPDAQGLPPFESLEFSDVCFTYPDAKEPVLTHFNLKIENGLHYAVVGQNGAGKTTMAKLLLGLYENYTGKILYNGRDIREFSYASRKALLGVVFQDFASYSVSVLDNIKLGDLSLDDEERMKWAAQQLALTDAILQMPQGFDTELGKLEEDSVGVSGGQAQRLAIARCLYHDAPLQILDEPTASLDPVAESRIYEMFAKISQGKTTVFITHRLGAAMLSDCVVLIDGGKVTEMGSHEALMQKGGQYAEMFELQRSWYR